MTDRNPSERSGRRRPDKTAATPSQAREQAKEPLIKFSPDEEAEHLARSNELKRQANALFAAAEYDEAVTIYDEALEACPYYLSFERAVLKSNVAACHLQTTEWKKAAEAATGALKYLDPDADTESTDEKDDEPRETVEEDEADEEIVSAGAQKAERAPETVEEKKKVDVDRIRSKALLRRAKAKGELGGWGNLSGAEEDYKQLATMTNLTPADMRLVKRQLQLLPPRTKVAQEKELGEMMGNLKKLGNGILSPFGLSTDNFKMTKDEKSGGYSMNFSQ